MVDYVRQLRDASANLRPGWDEAHLEYLFDGVRAKVRRRRTVRIAAASALGLLLCAGALVAALTTERWAASRDRAAPGIAAGRDPTDRAPRPAHRLPDGSTVTALGGESRFEVVESTAAVVVVEVERGAARFDVTRRSDRTFRVRAGPIDVEVVGTAFTVHRARGAGSVVVHRGRVRAECEGEIRELDAGETMDCVPSPASASGEAPGTPSPGTRSPQPSADDAPSPSPTDIDMSLGASIDGGAVDNDATTPTAEETESMDVLLAAADEDRRAGRLGECAAHLDRALASHPGDPRAPLAAFTLGRVLLEQVGQPREAARAFERARELAPSGALAEDALAREVEAWARAGEPGLARQQAHRYLERYPEGRRERLVRRHGGLE